MNKIMSVLCASAFALQIFAAPTYTAKVKITMSSANADDKSITLREAAAFSDAYDDGYDSESPNAGGLYVLASNNSRWLKWATNNLDNTKIGLATVADATYTFTFSGVVGSSYYLKDAVTGTEKLIVEGDTYVFDATPNATIDDRFTIGLASVPAAPELCFNYNVLTVNGHDGESLVIKQGDTEIDNVAALGNTYSKDLSAYNGRLVVILNGQAYQIDANPATTPAN